MTLKTFRTAINYGLIPRYYTDGIDRTWLLSCENRNCNKCPFLSVKHSCSIANDNTFTDDEYNLFQTNYLKK